MKSPSLTDVQTSPDRDSHREFATRRFIRDRLEADAWKNHSGFARKLAQRRNRVVLKLAPLLLLALSIAPGVPAAEGGAPGGAGIEFIGAAGNRHAIALHTAVDVDITGLLARVEVIQQFRNDGGSWAEAVYRFPLPPGAAVDRLQVQSGGKVIEGEIREKEAAQRQYQQARADGMLAALVDQQRENQFETRLANIEPGTAIEVRLGFLLNVEFADGGYSLELPLTFTPRWEPPRSSEVLDRPAPAPLLAAPDADTGHRLSIAIGLRQAMNLARIESRYHEVDIRPVPGGYDLFLADPDTLTDRVFRLEWAPQLGRAPQAELLTYDGGDAVYALLMLAPPLPAAVAPQPREVVFVIDTSGSMAGASIEQARLALVRGLDALDSHDWFNVVEFNSDSDVLFRESVPADLAHLEEAAEFIEQLEADGGTNMAAALDDALSLPPVEGLLRQVVFITDGSVGNEEVLLQQIAAQIDDNRLFTVAIGAAPNAGFMRKAALFGRGSFTPIGKLDEVEERMAALWHRIENPALTGIEIDWGMDAEYYPELVPDLYAGEPLWLYARLPLQPHTVHLTAHLEGRAWEHEIRPQPSDGGGTVAVLWARSRIQALEDSRVFGFDPQQIREQVTALALEFGLLSPYTSLVAVDRLPVRPVHASLGSQDVPSLLPAGSAVVTHGFSATATHWHLRLGIAVLGLLLTAGLLLLLPRSP